MVAERAFNAAFTLSDMPMPHRERAKRILCDSSRRYADYSKCDRWSALWDCAAGRAAGLQPRWAGRPRRAVVGDYYRGLWLLGARRNHALFVLIHDYTHNVVFKKANANRLGSIFANIAIVFPAAIGFRNHHLLHHK